MAMRRHCRWMEGCLLWVSLIAAPRVAAAGPAPEDVLEQRGLSRSGLLYVLADAESGFFEQLKSVQPYFARLKEGRSAILAIAESDANIRVGENRMSELNSNIGLLDRTIGRFRGRNTVQKQELMAQRAALVQERANLRPQLDAAKAGRITPAQRRQVFDEFEKRRTEFLEKAKAVRPAAEEVQSQYEALARDNAVADALKSLRQAAKAPIQLGPSEKFKSAYREFQAAVNGAKTPEELMKEHAGQNGSSSANGKRASAH